jgi:hypothetical protein
MGAVEETGKAVGGVIDAFRSTPAMLAIIIMNIGLMLLLYYYMNRITTRTEVTLKELFISQDKLFNQWGTVVKDTNSLTEKALHCILPDDALKLLQVPPRPYGSDTVPARPAEPAPVRPQHYRSPVFKQDITVPFFQPLKFEEPKEGDGK